MDLSIVLCTWNNCRRLTTTLEAIGRCSVPAAVRWELVVVANNCTDGTADEAQRFTGRLPLRHVVERRQGLSHARNTGVETARGRLIIFADDDITPCPDWIGAYWRAYAERPAGYYFGGPLRCEYEAGPPEPDVFVLAGMPVTGLDWGPTARVLEPHERFLGANWACPADVLRRAGGFDPRLGLDASLGRRRVGEEWDMMGRLRDLGIEPWYLPDAVVTHFVPAHKSRLEYTASNWEASGVYSARCSAISTPFLHRRPYLRAYCEDVAPRLGGVPWRAYGGAVRFLLQWAVARMLGRNAYRDYASWRFCRGAISGFRERRRERLEAPPRRRVHVAR